MGVETWQAILSVTAAVFWLLALRSVMQSRRLISQTYVRACESAGLPVDKAVLGRRLYRHYLDGDL